MKEIRKGAFLKKLREKADVAAKAGAELGKKAAEKAAERGPTVARKIKEKSLNAIDEGIAAARKASTSGEKNLKMLRELGELRAAGIITEKEFQAKKKEILGRV